MVGYSGWKVPRRSFVFTYGVFPRILRKGRASAMNVARNPCLHLAIYGVNVFVLSGVLICDTWGIPLFSVFFCGGNEEIGEIP